MNYVYVVINVNCGVAIKNKIFGSWSKADDYREELCELYPNNAEYYVVESWEVL
jgi:hypothetical protein